MAGSVAAKAPTDTPSAIVSRKRGLVGVAADGDRPAAWLGEVPPFGDEHARPLGVGGDRLDVGLDERRQALDGVAPARLVGRPTGGRFERRRRPVDDRPEEILL